MMGVGILASLLGWNLTHQTPPPKVGAPAPAFSLPRLAGQGDLSLSSLRGKTVVLNFFASWCAPCKREAPDLEAVWRRYRSDGLVVLGIDSGDTRGRRAQLPECPRGHVPDRLRSGAEARAGRVRAAGASRRPT